MVPGFAPTGPDVLALAAYMLPMVVAPGGLASCDVYAAVAQAVDRLGLGRDRAHGLRLADEAVGLFAAYLTVAGEAVSDTSAGRTVQGWVLFGAGGDLISVQGALLAAVGFWRRQLDPSLARPASVRRWRR